MIIKSKFELSKIPQLPEISTHGTRNDRHLQPL